MRTPLIKISYILSVLILCGISVSAQNRLLNGLVMDRSSMLRVGSASITNKTTRQVQMSNDLGLFRISAAIGDTLIISKPGYSDQVLVLPSLEDLVVRLQAFIALSEVTVKGQSKKQELDEIKEQYRKKGAYFAGKPPLLVYIFKPLTALYELTGKLPGQARRFNAFYITELQQTEIDRRFNTYTVGNITGLEGNDLRNFIFIYRPSYVTLSTWDEYALIRYVKKSLITFNSSGRPKGLLSLPPLPKAPDLSEKVLKY